MAYPMTQMPTLNEFIQKVKNDYNTEIANIKGKVVGQKGQAQFPYFKRQLPDNTVRIAPVPSLHTDEPFTPTVLRSLCIQLSIPPKDFGFTLD